MIENQLSCQGIQVKKALFKDIPPIHGDNRRLEEMVYNLILNAMQALMAISINDRQISITTFTGAEKTAILVVSDNATGVSEDIKYKIFEPFFTTKEVGEGMGIGLAIVHSIVTLFNGRIQVKGNEKGGATFRVEFPVLEAEKPVKYSPSSIIL